MIDGWRAIELGFHFRLSNDSIVGSWSPLAFRLVFSRWRWKLFVEAVLEFHKQVRLENHVMAIPRDRELLV
jgi:hypothetical protein